MSKLKQTSVFRIILFHRAGLKLLILTIIVIPYYSIKTPFDDNFSGPSPNIVSVLENLGFGSHHFFGLGQKYMCLHLSLFESVELE